MRERSEFDSNVRLEILHNLCVADSTVPVLDVLASRTAIER